MSKKNQKPAAKNQKGFSKPISSTTSSTNSAIPFDWIALAFVLFCTSLIRFRLLSIPLERDEGEYAYIARLMMKGIAPYTEAYTMKLPGTSFMYAIMMQIFGSSITGIHAGMMLIGIATVIFLFLAFKRLFNSTIALFSVSVYAIMSVSPTVLGFAAHATHFIMLFVAVALFFLAKYFEKSNFLYAGLIGLMMGLSFMMKQQAVFFIIFGGLAIVIAAIMEKPFRLKAFLFNSAIYSIAAVLPYVLTVLFLKSVGSFDKFWFWTMTYAGKYASGLSVEDGFKEFNARFTPMLKEFTIFWILFFAGIVLTFISKLTLRQKVLIFLFSICAFLTVVPGLYFRRHYFIAFLPAIGLMGGVALFYLTSLLQRNSKAKWIAVIPFIVFCIAAIAGVSGNKDYYFSFTPNQISKQQYGNNPFIESIQIADYIKRNSSDTAKIAILGSEPQIAFYADRLSATGYIYTYPLVEIQPFNAQMQDEMMREIEKNKPEFIVYCLISASWLGKQGAPDTIFSWFNTYSSINYDVKGIIDIYNEQTVYKWDAEALTYKASSQQQIMVYKRKEGF